MQINIVLKHILFLFLLICLKLRFLYKIPVPHMIYMIRIKPTKVKNIILFNWYRYKSMYLKNFKYLYTYVMESKSKQFFMESWFSFQLNIQGFYHFQWNIIQSEFIIIIIIKLCWWHGFPWLSLSPSVSINHWSQQVFQTTSRVCTDLL